MPIPSRLPIIQAPMAGAQGPDMCVAVCKAGGLGTLPGAMVSPADLCAHIAAVRAQTDAPFNVNFFAHQPPPDDADKEARWLERLAPYYAEAGVVPPSDRAPVRQPFGEEMCALMEEARPAVVSFHFGLPDAALFARVKATGALTLSTATTVAEARWLVARGVDVIVAQGREAGGHRGMFLSQDIDAQPGLFALLPQICAVVDVPVIAAGGIATGRGVAAAFMLGACAAQIGTAYLLTPQATITPLHRAALRAAQDDATRLTNLYTGRPARSLMTRFMRDEGPMNPAAPAFPLAARAAGPLRAAYEAKGSSDFTPLWSGEAAALAREMDAGELTRRLWEDALDAARGLEARMGAA